MVYCCRILVQVTTYRRLRIGRDGHLDQSEEYDMSDVERMHILHIGPTSDACRIIKRPDCIHRIIAG